MQEPGFPDPTMPPEMQERLGTGGDQDWNLLPGMDGIPFRTKNKEVHSYKEDDPDHLRPQVQNEVNVKIFNLGDAAQLEEYKKVLNMCAQALGRVMSQDVQYRPKEACWQVFLTWAVYFYEDPRETRREQKKFY